MIAKPVDEPSVTWSDPSPSIAREVMQSLRHGHGAFCHPYDHGVCTNHSQVFSHMRSEVCDLAVWVKCKVRVEY